MASLRKFKIILFSRLVPKATRFDRRTFHACRVLFNNHNNRSGNRVRMDVHEIQPQYSATGEDHEIRVEREYAQLTRSVFGLRTPSLYQPESLLLIHPRVRKRGRYVDFGEREVELKLEEAVALCQTIPGFRVVRFSSIFFPLIL
jgi:hypothetical protein